MSDSPFRPRVPAGVPGGGQFTTLQRNEADVTVSAIHSAPAEPVPAPVQEAPKPAEAPTRVSSSENPEM
ncbi:hypothetical protein [Arthrobacter caoxuetaonis]|uniref:Uncharacterized protein n=1 Tax=Arthrobacter caoxuetaonis TaxID=2886935 RepID=A0A9X1MH68_9MICC|nr:hypothetical protein [Arthrobacter caoxuetaonis]MCC3299297.1 hypothetical protein [Arthrobacter caoxuetaonis]USQ59210.1 hypothetical protein NF551_16635 [Arthrobacter caoxuetaonis]